MITQAPPDFWDKVIDRVAQLIWQRECSTQRTTPYVTTPILPTRSTVLPEHDVG